MKKILITGQNSYIGTSLVKTLEKFQGDYEIVTVDMHNNDWESMDVSTFDSIFHVAAIVHQKEKPGMEELYDRVNHELPVKVAKKAKDAGVSQFVFLSTMAVYGKEGKLKDEVVIDSHTTENPKTLYAISKLEAEKELIQLSSYKFNIAILRPPMAYGPDCPGNYAILEKIALRTPIFPYIDNKRSMIHIDQLCKFVKKCIDENLEGLFLPQDDEYQNTSLLVQRIARSRGRTIILSRMLGYLLVTFGKRSNLVNKVFGNLMYGK